MKTFTDTVPTDPGAYWLSSIPEGIEMIGEMRFDGRWITMCTGMTSDFSSRIIAESFLFGPKIPSAEQLRDCEVS